MHRIVIVGGGAGGLELATRLGDKLGRSKRAHVTLVDRCATHIWKPLLHEVASGSLDTHVHQIAYAAHARWHHFEFCHGELIGLNRSQHTLLLGAVSDAEHPGEGVLPPRDLEYDTLILALGSQTHFFGVTGAQENAITLDTLPQAERLRRRLLQTCVKSSARKDGGRSSHVDIVIIGGGATGVELAAELRRMEAVLREFKVHRADQHGGMSVTLLEAGPRILPALPPDVTAATSDQLRDLRIDVSVGDPVIAVESDTVVTQSGRRIPSDVTIWAAGIKAPACLAKLDGLSANKINQLNVSRTLQSESDPDIFALGDCASCPWTGDRMVPPRAQAAHQQAIFLFHAIQARLRGEAVGEFRYSDYGSLISLGPTSAVGVISPSSQAKRIFVKGRIARVMYSALYRKHLAAVSGLRKTLVGIVVDSLRRLNTPGVKLH
ncbi:NAD(P)/FAD-dependent oxidoreductase [Paraburkholderia sacchari]|uniref:NAD(P)/FAD-dependent oxidoreductase n=1 Tax=Paraburkholderia sacchari TaxID=159450 RepID=UPI001BCA6CAE|nr:NAD(P)/FAD-dependent oxidoreductase [Paraburkholderia sacchari]